MNFLISRSRLFSLALAGVLIALWSIDSGAQTTLESTLLGRSTSEIAGRAHILGDPERGAVIFYRQGLSCTQCHTAGEGAKLLGPDLSLLGQRATYEHIVDSILRPSDEIQDGFKSEKILTVNGQLIVGMIRAESDDELQVMVPGEDAARRISTDDVDVRVPANSMMPAGLINQLRDETEFFDLVSYLAKLGQVGPGGAADLRPDAGLIAPLPLPDYEEKLDHAGMIRSWNQRTLQNGEAVYRSLCVNCHGTKEEAGSLPNALRFASGKFRGGSDPYSMYKTITHGYKMMLPQRQLVPRQKYDVIHYIREAYLKPYNPSQYTAIDDAFLAGLPKGKMRGPVPVQSEPWREMDYGPFLISTFEMVGADTLPRPGISKQERLNAAREGRPPGEVWPANTNFAYKGIAVRLDDGPAGIAAGSHFMALDHDTLRIAGAWTGRGFIDWKGILFNGNHAVTPRTVGDLHFGSLPGPGWAHPVSGSFDDPRMLGKDGRAYGPLPRDWAQYKGLYKHGDRVVVSYSVGDANVLETHSAETVVDAEAGKESDPSKSRGVRFSEPITVWTRTLNVGQSTHDLTLRVAPEQQAIAAVSGELVVESDQGYLVVRVPAEKTPVRFDLRIAKAGVSANSLRRFPEQTEDLHALTGGGASQWPVQSSKPQIGNDDGVFAVDTLSRPTKNPWKSRLRMSGLDFVEGGDSMIACCCDGDVWRIDGINDVGDSLAWKRIASGLFHPLGIKIVSGKIYVTCRDQIVILNDLNGDGETDFYECFNNDHQVTDHFHEFAMGLQADAAGNLYYAKSARHARDSLVPQHGTLLRVSADGATTTIVANGFRAANGVCLNPDGSFFVTDQEGHWNPMNRINRVTEGGFYGNMYGYGAPDDSSDDAMEPPLCWPNKAFDRSPSELLWVDSDAWGPLSGSLLNLSYGYGKVYLVPHEKVGDTWQGGMCRLPLPQFPTGVMRARFHPGNGQMYACGMNAWGSDQSASPGGLYRIRYTGAESLLPIGLAANTAGMKITFTEAVDLQTASDPNNYLVDTWGLKRTANYGSDLYDEQSLTVDSVEVSEDGRSVTLQIPGIRPTWCMQISYKLKSIGGKAIAGTIQNTVHQLTETGSAE